jgi:peptidyl-tRNA hydrolase, PTH1 family
MDRIIVGLGNPGKNYDLTRHNVGFSYVQRLAEAWDFPAFKADGACMVSGGILGSHKVLACLPYSYMNLSGQALSPILRFYKMQPSQILVIHDELDLPCGSLRGKRGGGNGGHRGLRNIDQHLGCEYDRLRVGISHPGHKDAVSHYVLGHFRREEALLIDAAFDRVERATPFWMSGSWADFMIQLSEA